MQLLQKLTGDLEGHPSVEFTRITFNKKEWFLLSEVENFIGISNLSPQIVRSDEYEESEEYTVIKEDNLRHLKRLLNQLSETQLVNPKSSHLILLSRSGLNLVATKTEKPIGKALRRWLSREVLPNIQDTGHYSTHRERELGIEEARLRKESYEIYYRALLESDQKGSALIVASYIASSIGLDEAQSLLPALSKRYYTPTELGKLLGKSPQMVGHTLVKLGIHGRQDIAGEHCEYFKNKVKGINKEVPSYRYDDHIKGVLKKHFE